MLDKKTIEIGKLIKITRNQLESLNAQVDLGIMDEDSAEFERRMLTRKERALVEQLVSTRHVTLDGEPRAISYHEPTSQNPKAYWITKMPDGKKIKASTRDGLIDKLYEYYSSGASDLSVLKMFKAALYEKAITENPKQNTLEKNENHRVDLQQISSEDSKKNRHFFF